MTTLPNNIAHNFPQHNNTQHHDTQHNNTQYQSMLSVVI
jgi:hypothetical protein